MNLLIVLFCVSFCMVYGHPYNSGESNPTPVPESCVTSVSAFPPDPTTKCCGIPSATVPKIPPGLQALLYQYPWVALLEYVKSDGQVNTLCNGVLISGKYVLTGAHCVTGFALRVGKLENVRLGEYDTSNEGKDCVSTEDGEKECTDGAIRIPIEKIIPHREYNSPNKEKYKNDIALIRLKEMAPYTEFIRPICLPELDKTLNAGSIYFNKAGWGITSGDQNKPSNIKLQVKVPLVPRDECESSFGSRNVSLWQGQFCAGGQEIKDFCRGDGGSPLMFENGETTEVAGIVSFGASGCTGKLPTVNTNVHEYLDWIKSNIVA